jgi:hypothetical protein
MAGPLSTSIDVPGTAVPMDMGMGMDSEYFKLAHLQLHAIHLCIAHTRYAAAASLLEHMLACTYILNLVDLRTFS